MADLRTVTMKGGTAPQKSTPAPKKKKACALLNSRAMVTLYAGSKDTSEGIVVHKDFACYHSLVLRAALNSDFSEGQSQTYILDTTHETARLLVNWMYTEKFDILQPEDQSNSEEENMNLVKMWILADRLLMPRLQNATIRKIEELEESSNIVATPTFIYIYANTSDDSPLRKYIVDVCTSPEPSWFKDHADQFPKELLIDLISRRGIRGNSSFDIKEYEVPED